MGYAVSCDAACELETAAADENSRGLRGDGHIAAMDADAINAAETTAATLDNTCGEEDVDTDDCTEGFGKAVDAYVAEVNQKSDL
jgi:hypothetical protein